MYQLYLLHNIRASIFSYVSQIYTEVVKIAQQIRIIALVANAH